MTSEEIRTELWQTESRIVSCPEHEKDFEGKPYVLSIDLVREFVHCGHKDCNMKAEYEIELSRGRKQMMLEAIKN